MKSKKKNWRYIRVIAPGFIILCLAVVWLLVLGKEETEAPESSTIKTEGSQPGPSQITAANQPSESASASEKSKLQSLQMPIIMYHHIRDFNDPADKVGTNLSVSPANFASQLDKIAADGYTTITFEDLKAGNIPEKPIMLTFDDGYDNFYTNAYPELKKHNMKAVTYVIAGDINKGGYMTAEQIMNLSKNGIEIGSHSQSHPDLSKVTTARAEMEIRESKTIIEQLTEKPLVSFCYPSGKYNAEIEKTVKDHGYAFAVTTNSGITNFSDHFALNRYRMNSDTNIDKYLK